MDITEVFFGYKRGGRMKGEGGRGQFKVIGFFIGVVS